MPRFSMLPTLLREITVQRTLPREPEPDLVMDDAEQVAAYTEAGRIDGVMAAAYLFQTARITQTIQGCGKVVDLGCGPATQLAQIAQLNPDTHFLGVDLSAEMLDQAEQYVHKLGINNIDFLQADITDIKQIEDNFADAVISTMALHHLPSQQLLEQCFNEIKRINKTNGAIYLVDFGRLKSLKSAIYFAYMNARYQPHIFSLDYERSLRAAFLKEDFEQLSEKIFGDKCLLYTTFPMPILVVIKTPDRGKSSANLQSRLRSLRSQLSSRYRAELNDIRMLFKLGGLKNDPF